MDAFQQKRVNVIKHNITTEFNQQIEEIVQEKKFNKYQLECTNRQYLA